MKKYLLLIDCLILVSLFAAEAQDVDQTMDFASRQYRKGNFHEAISLYQRVLFFDSLKIHSYEACRDLASCYVSMNDYPKARVFSGMAANLAPNDSLRAEQIFQISYLHLAENDYNYAIIELFSMKETESEYFQMKKHLYLGIAYFQQTNYQKSIDFFIRCIDTTNQERREELMNILDEVSHIEKRYNPKTAKILSMILPGLGQLYCGEYQGAANSLALTAGLAILYIITIENYSFVDASISVLPWFQRYYQGGYQNAEKAAIKRKENRIKKQYQKILSVIQT